MFVFANFLSAIARILDIGLSIYFWMILGRAIISWVNPDPYNPIVRFLYQTTEPVLYRLRRVIPYMGGMDLSPLAAILIIIFVRWFVVATLLEVALRIKMGGGL